MIRFQVKDATVDERVIVSRRSGKEYTFREQDAVARVGDEVRRVTIPVPEGAEGYPVGDYVLSPRSFFVDNYGKLGVRVILEPTK